MSNPKVEHREDGGGINGAKLPEMIAPPTGRRRRLNREGVDVGAARRIEGMDMMGVSIG